jgi:hypothetical protein
LDDPYYRLPFGVPRRQRNGAEQQWEKVFGNHVPVQDKCGLGSVVVKKGVDFPAFEHSVDCAVIAQENRLKTGLQMRGDFFVSDSPIQKSVPQGPPLRNGINQLPVGAQETHDGMLRYGACHDVGIPCLISGGYRGGKVNFQRLKAPEQVPPFGHERLKAYAEQFAEPFGKQPRVPPDFAVCIKQLLGFMHTQRK